MTNDEISLRDYFEARWTAHEAVHDQLKENINTSMQNIDRRLEEMNEFRAQIQQERGEFLGKQEYDSRRRELEIRINAAKDIQDKRINTLELAKSNMDGRMWAVGAGLTGLTIFLNVVFRYWTK